MSAVSEQLSAILWNITHRPRLVDVVDILLLTFIIYTLLSHTRQTRISQIIKGIVILLAASWVSKLIGMRTIHALLSWVINAGPVLLIVLFQPEIRRVLEELGTTSLFDPSARMQELNNTELIIDEMILALGNALIMLDRVSCEGEKNHNAILVGIQKVRSVYKALQEEGGDSHDDQA